MFQTVSCGEIAWTAPELLLGRKYSEKVDVYSYGVVLWEIITRSLPYAVCDALLLPLLFPYLLLRWLQGVHSMTAALQVLTGLRPEIPKDCNPYLKSILLSCWKTDPMDRPSMDVIIASLQSINV